jgi:hypothetical protein
MEKGKNSRLSFRFSGDHKISSEIIEFYYSDHNPMQPKAGFKGHAFGTIDCTIE